MWARSREARRKFQGFTPGQKPPAHGRDRQELERLARLRDELEATVPFGYPTSGDPNIIGEHEVAPVLCPCCKAPLPWALIKGWRD